jgi:hypothetical protein
MSFGASKDLTMIEQQFRKGWNALNWVIFLLLVALATPFVSWPPGVIGAGPDSIYEIGRLGSQSEQAPQPPVLFFTDLTGGPKTGGQDNKGAFVTVYGNNFGSSQGNSKMTLGRVPVDNCPVWGAAWLWYQKITCQLGSSVPVGTHDIVVKVNSAESNSLPFAVVSGHIYFVSTTGNDRNNGSFSSPWKSLLKARDKMRAGDITYAMNGVTQETDDRTGWDSAFLLSGGGHGNWCSASGSPRALVAYPSATSVVIGNPSGDLPHFGLRTSDCQGNWVFGGISFRGMIPVGPGGGSNYRFVALDITCPHTSQGGACFLTSQVEHTYLYGSHIYDGGTATASSQFHGVYFSTDSNHVDMGWNLVEYIHGCRGVQVHSSPLGSGGPKDPTGHSQYDLSIHDNIIHDTQCDGMIIDTVDPSKGPVTIYNNVLYNVGQGPANPENTGGWSGINIPGNTENGPRGSGNVEIYNNTIYAYGTFARPAYGHENSAIVFNGGNLGIFVHVRNNLILSVTTPLFHSGVPYFVVWKPSVGPCAATENCPGMYGNNNLAFGAGSAVPNAANITGTVTRDPQLLNVNGHNFKPQPGSPAIGAGVPIPGLTRDISGISRRAPPSIGAYE